ncbi:MAG: 4-hydroxy-tetrahydrodipicolinate reductase [Bacteroidales bacterium]
MRNLKIIIIGYGRMGREIKKVAEKRGHEILMSIDKDNQDDFTPENLKQADVAIEFTLPDAAYDNIKKCFDSNLPVVSGTTGWMERFHDIRRHCLENGKACFYASNFNIGMNLFFKVNEYLARIMNHYSNYDVKIEETHHVHKVDAPSGTAVKLAESLINEINRKNKWRKEQSEAGDEIPVKAIREDEVPGIHRIMYFSSFDDIELKHSAKSREGFALGAVMAAEFIHDKQGIYSMDDLLNI